MSSLVGREGDKSLVALCGYQIRGVTSMAAGLGIFPGDGDAIGDVTEGGKDRYSQVNSEELIQAYNNYVEVKFNLREGFRPASTTGLPEEGQV
jgi:hypothetical protein